MPGLFITMHESCHSEIHRFCVIASEVTSKFKFEHRLLNQEKKILFQDSLLDGEVALHEVRRLKKYYNLENDDRLVVFVDGNLYDKFDDEYFTYVGPALDDTKEETLGVGLISLFFLQPQSCFMREANTKLFLEMNDEQKQGLLSQSILLIILGIAIYLLTDLAEHEETRACVMDYCQNPYDMLHAVKRGFTFCTDCISYLDKSESGRIMLEVANRLNTFSIVNRRIKIFLNYAREDTNQIESLYNSLRASGFEPWMDTKDIYAGDSWPKRVETAIRNSDFFLWCISQNASVQHGVIEREREIAREIQMTSEDRHNFIIPIRLEDLSEPAVLQSMQRIDLFGSGGNERVRDAIAAAIRRRWVDHLRL